MTTVSERESYFTYVDNYEQINARQTVLGRWRSAQKTRTHAHVRLHTRARACAHASACAKMLRVSDCQSVCVHLLVTSLLSERSSFKCACADVGNDSRNRSSAN